MKKIEMIEQIGREINPSQKFTLYKISDGNKIQYVIQENNAKRFNVVAVTEYEDISVSYSTPYLRWSNLMFCSNSFYLNEWKYSLSKVFEGKKTCATYGIFQGTFESFSEKLPDGIEAKVMWEDFVFVYRIGCLNDYFCLSSILNDYKHNGINLDERRMDYYFNLPISEFSNEKITGIKLQGCDTDPVHMAITGLLLGYPIESTIALLLNKEKTRVHKNCPNDQRKRLLKNEMPAYQDICGDKWFVYNGEIVWGYGDKLLYFDE